MLAAFNVAGICRLFIFLCTLCTLCRSTFNVIREGLLFRDMTLQRTIMHVDMDAFYASIEQQDNSELRGQPVVVGGSGPRGVVAAASYEVRRFGVFSAMPMRRALALCPAAVCVRPRFDRYREVSCCIFTIFEEFTPLIQGLSLDEAFLDVTNSLELFGEPETLGREIKDRIRKETRLTASVGIAPNKLVAKIASDLDKPDGLVCILEARIAETLDPLPVRTLPGIGPRTAEQLVGHGIDTLKALRQAPDRILQPLFGRFVQRVRQRAGGIDDRPVEVHTESKSISSEQTFDEDIANPTVLNATLHKLADQTGARLRDQELVAGSVYVKLRTADFRTFTRQRSFSPPGQSSHMIGKVAGDLLATWLEANRGARLRLLGVGVAGLAPASQLSLFGEPDKGLNADRAVDGIHDRFGRSSLKRARELE